MHIYHGTTDGVVKVDGELLPPRNDLLNHSPSGFQWGYGGSGPAQLALAILAHHLGEDKAATVHYQEFKTDIIANLEDNWAMTTEDVQNALEAIQLGAESRMS